MSTKTSWGMAFVFLGLSIGFFSMQAWSWFIVMLITSLLFALLSDGGDAG